MDRNEFFGKLSVQNVYLPPHRGKGMENFFHWSLTVTESWAVVWIGKLPWVKDEPKSLPWILVSIFLEAQVVDPVIISLWLALVVMQIWFFAFWVIRGRQDTYPANSLQIELYAIEFNFKLLITPSPWDIWCFWLQGNTKKHICTINSG